MPYKYSASMPDDCPSCMGKDPCKSKSKYYRMIDNLPISEDDFLPHLLIPKEKAKFDSKKRSTKEHCKWSSVSVFRNLDDFFEIIKTSVRLKEKFVIAGEVDSSVHGVVLNTPGMFPSHVDWFPYKGVEETHIFKEVAYVAQK